MPGCIPRAWPCLFRNRYFATLIIFRYLARSILANTLGVSAVLMLVVVSSRFVKYLAEAATGKLEAGVLFAIIGFRLPGFFELVLPLAFFLSIMLAYGQLYVDSEMTVLRACGMSEKQLVGYTMVVAVLVAALVGWLSLSLSPSGYARVEQLLNAQKQRGEIESLIAGRFYTLRDGRGVTYAEEINDGQMREVFLAQSGAPEEGGQGMVVVLAKEGYSQRSDATGDRYLVLEDGRRIQGIPGEADFQITRFEEYGQRLDSVKPWELSEDAEAIPTAQLWRSQDPADRALLQWRLSLPVMVLVVSLLAVPLSRTYPRQGRYAKILPAVLLYVFYLLGLNAARDLVESREPPGALAMVAVHALFIWSAVAGPQ